MHVPRSPKPRRSFPPHKDKHKGGKPVTRRTADATGSTEPKPAA